jgi:diaminopimelate decarboxylase
MSADTVESRSFAKLGHTLTIAAERFGTPVYVLDMVSVAAAARQVESAFGPPWLLHYSLKANDLPALAGYLASRGGASRGGASRGEPSRGWGGAVVSTGEWQHARYGGLTNDAVVFEGIGKTDAQLGYAVAETAAGRPPRWLVVESPAEFGRLAGLAAAHGLGRGARPSLDVLLRLNPGVAPETSKQFAVGAVTSKFGMPEDEILVLAGGATDAGPGLTVRGIHVHVGSALADTAAWAQAGVRATGLLGRIAGHCPQADTVDYGGGFPLPGPGLSGVGPPGPAQFRDALLDALDRAGLSCPARPAIEPGRYLVGGAGWLVCSVLHTRGPAGDQLPRVVLDAGMTELIRPALYGSEHPVFALRSRSLSDDLLQLTTVDGPICESTDALGTHPLPPLERGDLVVIGQAGAYAASFSSRYNGRPHPLEVAVWPGGELELCERPPIRAVASYLQTREPQEIHA